MKRYVGTAKIVADSRTPRRLISATTAMASTASETRMWNNSGAADVTAAMPAATLTETVRT